MRSLASPDTEADRTRKPVLGGGTPRDTNDSTWRSLKEEGTPKTIAARRADGDRGAPEVLTAGYVVLDLIDGPGIRRHNAGGTAGNVAGNLSWLGIRPGVMARIGTDPAGEAIVSDLLESGVDVTHVTQEDAVATPMVVHQIRPDGNHRYLFTCPTCRRRFPSHRPPSLAQVAYALAPSPRIFFFDRASLAAIAAAEAAKGEGRLVVFEPNSAGREALTRRAAHLADIVKVSSDRLPELDFLVGTATREQVHIKTLGSAGAEYRWGKGKWRKLRAYNTEVVDSGGAGDWVTSGLLATLITDGQYDEDVLVRGLRIGQALASVSCRFLGARGMSVSADPSAVFGEIASILDTKVPFLPRTPTDRKSAPHRNSGCPVCFSPTDVQKASGQTAE